MFHEFCYPGSIEFLFRFFFFFMPFNFQRGHLNPRRYRPKIVNARDNEEFSWSNVTKL